MSKDTIIWRGRSLEDVNDDNVHRQPMYTQHLYWAYWAIQWVRVYNDNRHILESYGAQYALEHADRCIRYSTRAMNGVPATPRHIDSVPPV